MKRTPLQRKAPLQAKSPMKHQRSKRARARDFSPSVRETVAQRSGGVCEICKQRPVAHLHHAQYRSSGGTGEIANALGVCIVCHEVCHSTRAMRQYAVELAKELASCGAT